MCRPLIGPRVTPWLVRAMSTCPASFHVSVRIAMSACPISCPISLSNTMSAFCTTMSTCCTATCLAVTRPHYLCTTTCHLRTVPHVTSIQCHVSLLVGQITLKNAKNDWHVACLGVATCNVDVSMMYYWHHHDVLLTSSSMSTIQPLTSWLWLWLFTCLGKNSNRHNFRIRCPFSKKNILLESTRRSLHDGASFVRFQELWNFGLLGSILDHICV
jgi:hypothetical protein